MSNELFSEKIKIEYHSVDSNSFEISGKIFHLSGDFMNGNSPIR